MNIMYSICLVIPFQPTSAQITPEHVAHAQTIQPTKKKYAPKHATPHKANKNVCLTQKSTQRLSKSKTVITDKMPYITDNNGITRAQINHAPKPSIQRRTTKDDRPLNIAPVMDAPKVITPTKPRKKFRKNINKDALAAYFDNDNLQSAQAEWLNQVVSELDVADNAAAQTKYDAMYDLEQRFELFNALTQMPDQIKFAHDADYVYIDIITMPDEMFNEIKQVIEQAKKENKKASRQIAQILSKNQKTR